MSDPARRGPFQWTVAVPVLSLGLLLATWSSHENPVVLVAIAVALVGSILAAVHHAEVVAHRVGEPYGSLVLAVAVTVIEVGLIVMLMVGGGEGSSTYARDTVFAALMITLNGIASPCSSWHRSPSPPSSTPPATGSRSPSTSPTARPWHRSV